MDQSRKQQILTAENAERLRRALAAEGVYVLGGLGPHGLKPDDPLASSGVEAASGPTVIDQTLPAGEARCGPDAAPGPLRVTRATDQPDQRQDHAAADDRQEAVIDEGVEDTVPASDPASAKHMS